MDAREIAETARSLMNLHNNRAGRKVRLTFGTRPVAPFPCPAASVLFSFIITNCLCHSFFPCSVFTPPPPPPPIPLICHRPPTLPSSPCSVIVLLRCHRPPALPSFSFSAIVLLLSQSLYPYNYVIIILLCHLIPVLPSSFCSVSLPLVCHRLSALSLYPCSAIILLLCHFMHVLTSSFLSAIVPLLCHRPPVVS